MTTGDVVCPRCSAKLGSPCTHVKSGLALAKPHPAREYLASRNRPSPDVVKKQRVAAKEDKKASWKAELDKHESANHDILWSLTAPLRSASRVQDEKPMPKWHSCMTDGCENDTGDPQKLKCNSCDPPKGLSIIEEVWRRSEELQQKDEYDDA